MSTKIYPGISLFFANREGNHNYLANNKRPMFSACITSKKGKRSYYSPFIGKDVAVTETKDTITLTFPKDINRPIASQLIKD